MFPRLINIPGISDKRLLLQLVYKRSPFSPTQPGGRRGPRQVDVNDKPRAAIDSARRRYGCGAPPGKIIADISFGVWRYLSSSAHEKTLWVPHLHLTFPPGTSRAVVDRRIGDLHELRNRAAHWEPLPSEPVQARMADLLTVARELSAPLTDYIQRTSRVDAVLHSRP